MTVSDEHAPDGVDLALEFVRFCYRRRRVAWPLIYDEMCAVAGHGIFRGMGYSELAERGISFCLSEMPRLCGLAQRVIAEEAAPLQPLPAAVETLAGVTSLNLAPAT